MKRFGIAIAVAVLASPALADRITGAPPTDCPAGSYPHVDHGGPHCAFVRCSSDADCAQWDPELSCGPQASICVLIDEFNTYARRPAQRERAGSACVDGACAEGECRTDRFCVRGASADDSVSMESTMTEPSMEPSMEASMEAEPSTMDTSTSSEEESGCSVGGAASLPALFLLVLLRRRR